LRILIIDDDGGVRAVLRATLELEGHQVAEAHDGDEAVRAARRGEFDLALCDLFMPGTDGMETIRELRRESPALPVIAMSGGGFGGRLDLLPAAAMIGAAATLVKPFSRQTLRETIGRAVGPAAPTHGRAPASA
jgi:CheY-like chemotaxis protein